MTNAEKKAREVARDIIFGDGFDVTGNWELLRDGITKALLAMRDSALEEAAGIADKVQLDRFYGEQQQGPRQSAFVEPSIGARIRAAKTKGDA